MKLILFLAWREIRFRRKQLLPFTLIATALCFTAVSLITFQESANAEISVDYIATPTYAILLVAFALIGFTASRSYFSVFRESMLLETGILRALGMHNHSVRKLLLTIGGICVGAAILLAVPTALIYIYLFVKACSSMDMSLTTFVPLIYRIPTGNIILALLLLSASMLAGIMFSQSKVQSIATLIRSIKIPLEAENDRGCLPENGGLSDYGRLYVRRSIRRCIRYNAVIAFLLILPTIFLLGAATFELDDSTHTYTLWDVHHNAVDSTLIEAADQIPGISHTEGALPMKAGFGNKAIGIRLYAEEGVDLLQLRERVTEFAQAQNLKFDDTAVEREISNNLSRNYIYLFLTNAAILFAAGSMTSVGLLRARLAVRKRELSLLYALGAKKDALTKAVIPETLADYVVGAFLSVAFGLFGFLGIMVDGGGNYNVLPILMLCPLFLLGSILMQIKASECMTTQIIAKADIHL